MADSDVADSDVADAVVIGAGLSGLYALYRLRGLGLRARVLEAGDGVGGTWLWNRYPGARCDIESVEYSYSFSPEIEQEWVWTETMPAQPELESYVNFVADRLDLRRHIDFGATVTGLRYSEPSACWQVEVEDGRSLRARFVVAATGMLSVPLDPAIPGMSSFGGMSVSSGRFPREGLDVSGRRVALIGTGSSGVQMAPVLAAEADRLTIFQRSAAYTFATTSRPLEAGELDRLKADYPAIRAAQREAYPGTARISAFSFMSEAATRPPLRSSSRQDQLDALDRFGVAGAFFWSDVTSDLEANDMARALYGEAIARIVRDPDTAAALVPAYPFGCKRPIVDSGYFEMFNRDNVGLVDLRRDPIVAVEPAGIRTASSLHPCDVIVYATGFDAMTGALGRIDVRGRGGASLASLWEREGPSSYLGLQVAGFPNLFIVAGPGSPGALANVITSLELQVDWIADCLAHLREKGCRSIEATAEAQEEWRDHMQGLVEGTVATHPSCNSWWIGANVPGKKRVFMSYAGGVPQYRRRCSGVAGAGYAGFVLS